MWVSHDIFIEARYSIREMYRVTGDMRVDEERGVGGTEREMEGRVLGGLEASDTLG